MCFGQIGSVALAIPMLLVVGLCVKMANGARYAVVPLVHQGNLGAVAGIVGAGGNVGAVAAGYLFAPTDSGPRCYRTSACWWHSALVPLVMAIRDRPDTTVAPEAVAHGPGIRPEPAGDVPRFSIPACFLAVFLLADPHRWSLARLVAAS